MTTYRGNPAKVGQCRPWKNIFDRCSKAQMESIWYEMLCQNIYRMYLSCQSEWYLIIDIPSGIIQCLCRYLQRIYSLWKEGKKAEKQITFIWTGTQVSYYFMFHILNVSFTNNIVCQCIIIINGKHRGKYTECHCYAKTHLFLAATVCYHWTHFW